MLSLALILTLSIACVLASTSPTHPLAVAVAPEDADTICRLNDQRLAQLNFYNFKEATQAVRQYQLDHGLDQVTMHVWIRSWDNVDRDEPMVLSVSQDGAGITELDPSMHQSLVALCQPSPIRTPQLSNVSENGLQTTDSVHFHHEAKGICRLFGMQLAEISSDTFDDAANVLMQSHGPMSKAIIHSWNGDDSEPLVMHVGTALPGGAIVRFDQVVSQDEEDLLAPIICQHIN